MVVISTKIVESPTTTASVTVASKFPRDTPDCDLIASQSDAGSVIRSWLKKKGRSSVGAEKSRGYLATTAFSPCCVLAPMMSDKTGYAVWDCGLTKIVKWSLLA